MADAIVLLGVRDESAHLSRHAREFGWSAEVAPALDDFHVVAAESRVLAVYFDPRALAVNWERVLGHVMRAAPRAFPIACLHHADGVSVDQFTALGGFYVLHLPLAEREVQQSLGFLHAALSRRPATVVRMKNSAAQAG